MNYEAVIGLEVHVQLATKSKMFCGCSTRFGDPVNSNICPVCMAHPGTLPVANQRAVEMAIKTALALGGTVHRTSIFARKNYFYPDLTKGYQISQHLFPLCTGGGLEVTIDDAAVKTVSIQRIHLEEDSGKLTHDFGHPDMSHVDFNRCGVPLIEIVSGPDIRSPQEAGNYLRKLHAILVYLEVCEGNMQEGNLRCDANVSIRPVDSETFGTRTEIKNLNSFKMVEQGIAFEIKRQTQLLQEGKSVTQETRLWNDEEGKTESMRGKEEAHDYRYFPDPDLLPLIVEQPWIETIRSLLPELPQAKAKRFVESFGLPSYDAGVLTSEKAIAHYFEEALKHFNHPKKISNWIMTELLREIKNENISISETRIRPQDLAGLVKLIEEGTISGKIGKEIFAEMYTSGATPESILEKKGLKLISDTNEVEKIIDTVLAANTSQVEQYKSGKQAVFGFLVGQVMKETKGQANPKVVNDLLKKKLG